MWVKRDYIKEYVSPIGVGKKIAVFRPLVFLSFFKNADFWCEVIFAFHVNIVTTSLTHVTNKKCLNLSKNVLNTVLYSED